MPGYQTFLETRRQRDNAPVVLDSPVPLGELRTPTLYLDEQAFEANLARMQSDLSASGLGLRCHTKTHKCPEIARRQIAAGAVGVCCAKVGEAEVMADAGIPDILVTSPVATADAAMRAARLAGSGVRIVIDSRHGAGLLQEAAASLDVVQSVLIDLDPGMGRTGIAPGDALGLARYVLDNCPGLRFDGLQMYAGNCMHIEGWQARLGQYRETLKAGLATVAEFERAGIETPIVTGGGTGTWDMEADLGLFTDIQAGSYAFMDVEYRNIGDRSGPVFSAFEPSLFVLVTAISQPQADRITFDGGYKSMATDTVKPEFADLEGVRFYWGGDEHGIVRLDNPSAEVAPGTRLSMLTPHCDPTVNLYDDLVIVRDGAAHEIWPITARGRSQ